MQSTRLCLGLLFGLVLAAMTMAMTLGAEATHAATSDGRYFPCTDSFAKKVAIESGFAEVAAEFNPAYEDPEYWLAQQTVCADFDLDGNDEIVFTLGAMGGTDPWAFFDVPNGQANASTYSLPTIYDKGDYPNHALELVRVEGALRSATNGASSGLATPIAVQRVVSSSVSRDSAKVATRCLNLGSKSRRRFTRCV